MEEFMKQNKMNVFIWLLLLGAIIGLGSLMGVFARGILPVK